MTGPLPYIAYNTYREAVRDRVLYNLIVFALLMVGAAVLFGQISIGIEREVVINLGLAAITVFGIAIAIFLGIGLVSKEIERRTLYTVLARPVRRWQFLVGKYCGLSYTLVVNTLFMTAGFLAAVYYVSGRLQRPDVSLLVAIYFVVLELLIVTAVALLFSTFSSTLLSAVLAIGVFVVGTFAEDLRGFAQMVQGAVRYVVLGVAYLVPNFASFNVSSAVAHDQPVAAHLVLANTVYAACYVAVALAASVLIFEYRNLK